MGYAVFNAVGTVIEARDQQTRNGTSGRILLLRLGTSEYQSSRREVVLEAGAWGRTAEQASGVNSGDEVSVSGNVECQQSDRGYWNPRLRVREVCVLKKAQSAPQSAPYVPPQVNQGNLYANDDIPF